MTNNLDTSTFVLSTLRKIIRAIDIHSRQLSKQYGLTGPQLVVISEIGQYGSMTIGELARRISLSQATVTTILDRLEIKGLATRMRGSEDKRRVYVSITEKAQEILETHPNFLQEGFVKRFNALEDWEQTLILSSIQRIAAMMNTSTLPPEAYDIDPDPEG
ncbi:MarR family transcriptional regulator [Alkalispirochaeta sphaeroplastigenens]|uniref:Transcriptional regulator, MarR family n=2 Tax=Alkalispirochaeta TaxID=2024958 RepID=A0A1N6SWK0_9SPIO|nr:MULTISPECIES: MarR family transcriptional regulator [Alkalispirochaeta]POR03098.1 MarR family transcriptional regulator [Alkalispirochaeta sphaeroplastigenens]SIQ45404.1 transcriptional regulator, MarR family [Alkalispirochaeta americana]